ncbi:hypothetical protein ACFQAS_14505 [Halopenitus salinus]|uniref:Uncharacterized protein n=1 Tax=Halopenitus salinus TaxID=1198295 RepID=A0ABD5UUC1_9EURY
MQPDNDIEFDRVTDKQLCACIRGSLNTTEADLHGHVVPADLYPKFVESMKEHPERRLVSAHHKRDEIIGEILWAGVREAEEKTHLVGGVGIYEDERNRLNEIEKDILGGFSITLVGYSNSAEDDWDPDAVDFEYRGFGDDYHRLKGVVDEGNIPARFEVQKSAAGAFFLQAVAQNWVTILELAMAAWAVYEARKARLKDSEDPAEETTPQVVIKDTEVNVNQDIDEFLDGLLDALDKDLDEAQRQVVIEEALEAREVAKGEKEIESEAED